MTQDRSTPLLVVVMLVAVLGGGAYYFLSARSMAVAARDAQGAAAAQALEARARADAEALNAARKAAASQALEPTVLGDAEARLLSDAGFPRATVPVGFTFVIGRVVILPEPTDAASTPAAGSGAPAPVPGAEVSVHHAKDDGTPEGSPEQGVRSNSDGYFLVTVPSAFTWVFEARTPETFPNLRLVPASTLKVAALSVGDLVLTRAAAVEITVRSGLAEIQEPMVPVEGMEISIGRMDEAPLARGKTDKDGKLKLAGLPREELTIKGDLEPYSRIAQSVRVIEDGQQIELNVQLAGRLKLQCKSPTGSPLASFDLALDFSHETYNYVAPKFVTVETKDKDGWFLVEDLKAGTHELYATTKGAAISIAKAAIIAGETTELSVQLPKGFTIQGKVVRKSDGEPINGALVFSETDLIPSSVDTNDRESFRSAARATRTDNAGRFKLEDLTEGSHWIAATHKEYAEARKLDVKVGKDRGSDEELVISLPTGAGLKGHVFGQDGNPLAGSMIMVLNHLDPRALNMKKGPRLATTGTDGYYHIDHIAPGMRLAMKIRTDPKSTEPPFELKQQMFKDGIETVLDWGRQVNVATVTGRITNSKGEPLSGISATLMSTQGAVDGPPPFYAGVVDPDGTYTIRNVKGGQYRMNIAKAQKGSDFVGIGEVIEVPPAGVVRKDFVLDVGRISGLLVSASDGKPVARGEAIIFKGADGQDFYGRADVETAGMFSFDNLEAGSYRLVVSATDHSSKEVKAISVRIGETTTVPPISLEGGGRIIGTVLDAQGAPVGSAQILLVDPVTQSTQPAWTFGSQADGTFIANAAPVGTYAVTALKAGHTFPAVPVQVTAGNSASVTIRAQ